MSEKREVFRRVSLERLSSPEQLDALMHVTSSRGWLALLALCGVLVVALAWSVFGSIPSKVKGTCILIRPGGVSEIVAPGAGTLSDISVDVGDEVRGGQTVARIERLDGLEQVKATEAKLAVLRAQEANLSRIASLSRSEREAFWRDSEKNLNSRIRVGEERLRALEAKIQSQASLLEQGLITKQTWLSTKLEHAGVQQDIDGFRNEIRQLGVLRLDNTKQTQTELTALAIQIDETQRLLGRQMRASNEASLVHSPYNGRVIEVRSSEGVLVREGIPLLAIEQTGSAITDLEARIYVAPMDGKKVKTNMEVQVAPSSVKSEEYGYLLGKVRTVADFPSTAQGMMRILNNEDLVKQLAAGAAPISVQADLIPNAATVSGYRWSSPKGPDSRIESGTLCSANIIVKRQRPIALVLPFLRETLGL